MAENPRYMEKSIARSPYSKTNAAEDEDVVEGRSHREFEFVSKDLTIQSVKASSCGPFGERKKN